MRGHGRKGAWGEIAAQAGRQKGARLRGSFSCVCVWGGGRVVEGWGGGGGGGWGWGWGGGLGTHQQAGWQAEGQTDNGGFEKRSEMVKRSDMVCWPARRRQPSLEHHFLGAQRRQLVHPERGRRRRRARLPQQPRRRRRARLPQRPQRRGHIGLRREHAQLCCRCQLFAAARQHEVAGIVAAGRPVGGRAGAYARAHAEQRALLRELVAPGGQAGGAQRRAARLRGAGREPSGRGWRCEGAWGTGQVSGQVSQPASQPTSPATAPTHDTPTSARLGVPSPSPSSACTMPLAVGRAAVFWVVQRSIRSTTSCVAAGG